LKFYNIIKVFVAALLAVAASQFNGGGNNGGNNNGGGFGSNGGGWGHYHLGYGFVAQGGKGHEQHAVAKVHVQQNPHDYHYSVSYIFRDLNAPKLNGGRNTLEYDLSGTLEYY